MTALAAGLLLTTLAGAAPPGAEAPPTLYAGIYLSDVSGFDLREGRFQADLDVWLKWSGPKEPPALRFVNGEIASREEQERESDGDWHSIRWRVQGTFRGTFPLQAFPFDRQALRIQLATTGDSGRLIPDLGSSGMAQQFSITGWEYEPFFRSEAARQVVASDLGSIRNEGRTRALDAVTFVVDLHRPRTSNIIKFMLPLAIILAMAFLVFLLPASKIDVRSAMGVTSLLSVVAFHFAMAGSLPDVPYLVAADRLFLVSYVLVLLSIFETVGVFRLGDAHERLGVRIDRVALAVLPAVAVLVGGSVALPTPAPKPPDAVRPAAPALPPSPREELRVGTTALATLTAQGLNGLLRRGLTDIGPDGELRPHLAEAVPSMTDESVRLLPDGGMLVRWRLREGLRWSDGAKLTARDLVYSLGLVVNPDRAGVTQVDERTIEIRYVRRLSDALTDFALYPEHAAKRLFADGGMEAIRVQNQTAPLPGDGPYRVASFTAGKEAVFERNPYFAGPAPRLARVRVLFRTPEALVQELAKGELDLTLAVPMSAVQELKQAPAVVVDSAPEDAVLCLQPDLGAPGLGDLRVRRALLMALDRKRIAAAYAENGRMANTYRPDDAPDHAADAPRTPYEPDQARRALKEAGLSSLRLFTLEPVAGSAYSQALALVQAQLAAVGLKVEVVTLSGSKAMEAFNRGNHGGLLLYPRRDRRPARFFNLPVATGATVDVRTPRPHFSAATADAYQLYETSLFPERQRLLSMRLQRAFAEQLPLLPLAFGTQVSAHSAKLTGYGPAKSGSSWWNVETWALDE